MLVETTEPFGSGKEIVNWREAKIPCVFNEIDDDGKCFVFQSEEFGHKSEIAVFKSKDKKNVVLQIIRETEDENILGCQATLFTIEQATFLVHLLESVAGEEMEDFVNEFIKERGIES